MSENKNPKGNPERKERPNDPKGNAPFDASKKKDEEQKKKKELAEKEKSATRLK